MGFNYDGRAHLDLDAVVEAAQKGDPAAAMRDVREKYLDDLKRNRELAAMGRVILPVTSSDLFAPGGLDAVMLEAALAMEEFDGRSASYLRTLLGRPSAGSRRQQLIWSLLPWTEAQRYAPGKPSKWWTNTAKEFANGNVAMMINFSNYASEILGYSSKIVGNVGFGMIPGGNPIYGGGSLAVSRYSRHPQNALAFIKWLTREPVASAMAALGSVSPCIKTYNKYDIINTFPWLEFSKDCFPLSRTKRLPDSNLSPFDEKRFLNIIGTAVKNVMSGLLTTNEALERAQQMLDQDFRN